MATTSQIRQKLPDDWKIVNSLIFHRDNLHSPLQLIGKAGLTVDEAMKIIDQHIQKYTVKKGLN